MNKDEERLEESDKSVPGNSRAMNAVFTDSIRDRKRFRDENGFLHIPLRFMRTGTLKYLATPETFRDGVPPDAPGPDGMVRVCPKINFTTIL